MVANNPEIRSARVSDLDDLLAIEWEAFEGDRLSRRSFQRHLESNSATLLVAEAEKKISGYALVLHRQSGQSARIYSLAVATKFASQGIGRKLLMAVETRARALARHRLSLEVREDNKPALHLYKQAGFQLLSRFPNYYEDGAAALRFAKKLESQQ